VAVVVNLGGEGEVDGALNVNSLIVPQMFDAAFRERVLPELVLVRSAHDTGLPEGSADEVIAHHFPIQFDELVADESGARVPVAALAAEVVRILRSGGRLRFSCSSCNRPRLAEAFREAGLTGVSIMEDGYIGGTKP